MNRKVNIIEHEGFVGQGLYPWDSLDKGLIIKYFYDFDVDAVFVCLDELECTDISTESVFFTGSFQNSCLKKILEDKAYFIESQGATIIPRYELLLAHENKGFQSLMKKRLGCDDLNEQYLSSDAASFDKNTVYKESAGAGSHGVFISKDSKGFYKKKQKVELMNSQLNRLIKSSKLWIKQNLLNGWRFNTSMAKYAYNSTPLVLQDFVPDLECDYKVLIFGELFFVLKRGVKKGDFRASGSSLFEAVSECPFEILDKSKNFFTSLNTPYASLDIVISKGKAFVIEFQCAHFGPYTYQTAQVVYKECEGGWKTLPWVSRPLEWIYAKSVCDFL
ncbi:hypothetical protein [Colwellia psychrerythraea]|uniref:ATP-grasp domain-containing protein n=1 Tax=Colwellia psychrerythraea (strain 34H / ATCC BAA-681) TaxID=167879 RepID=Q483D9_COLP3|nr:hypothetical protein [Colwellia psychrerythraea]AAZ28036.1 hypothetical protein CPS_2101 [Colwellia psychrerythraea 34H]